MSLFTIPIEACGNHPGGTLTGTEPSPAVYLLTLNSPPDNRLTSPVCKAFLQALDIIEFGHKSGVVVTTSGISKFYSNGLDLEHAVQTKGFWPLLYEVFRRFLTYPMPTIALLNGHTFAGGLMLAISHDYRLAPHPRGFLSLNELLFGSHLPPPMAALFKPKIPHKTYRDLVLEAKRFTSADAVEAGLCDAVATKGGVEDALELIQARGLVEKGRTGVYSALKREMYKDLIAVLKNPGLDAEEARFQAQQAREDERREFGKVWYEQWLEDNTKAKL